MEWLIIQYRRWDRFYGIFLTHPISLSISSWQANDPRENKIIKLAREIIICMHVWLTSTCIRCANLKLWTILSRIQLSRLYHLQSKTLLIVPLIKSNKTYKNSTTDIYPIFKVTTLLLSWRVFYNFTWLFLLDKMLNNHDYKGVRIWQTNQRYTEIEPLINIGRLVYTLIICSLKLIISLN